MKTMTRFLSLMLVLFLLLPGMALAEKTEAELLAEAISGLSLPTPELPITAEPVTISVLFKKASINQTDFENMFQVKAIEQLTGISLAIQPIESSAWAEKLPLVFAGEEYSEIFLDGISFEDAANFGQAGYLRPLEDLLEQYAPNAMKILETIPNARKNVTSADGHIYVMPGYNGTPRDMLAVIFQEINGEWLQAVGMEVPDTLDGFYEMLKAFKEQDPNGNGEQDEIPWSYRYDGGAYNMVLGAFGFTSGRHDVIDGQYVYVPAQENFRYYLEFMRKLYSEGLLDSAIFTQTAEEYNAKMAQMIVGFMPGSHYGTIGLDNYLKTVNLKPLSSEYNNNQPLHPGNMPDINSYGMVITNKCSEEKAILAIKLLDYLYSEEGSFLTKCGPELDAWGDMVDGGYVRTVNEDGSYSYKLVTGDNELYGGSYAKFRQVNGLWSLPFFYTSAHEACIVGSDPGNNHITVKCMESGMPQVRRVGWHGMITFTEDDQDTLAPYVLMDEYVNRMVAKFITGEEVLDDASWANYIKTLESMDLETLVTTRQAAFDRWNND